MDQAIKPPRPRCEGTVRTGVRCIATTKNGARFCPNHDPARAAQRRADAAKGARREGDPCTELGTVDGIARRMARILLALEHDGANPKAAHTAPENWPAQLHALRDLLAVARARRPRAGDFGEHDLTNLDLERVLKGA